MLFVTDIGNTNITIGIFSGDDLIISWNLSSDKNKTDDEYGILIKSLLETANLSETIDSAVISSVVLPLTEKFTSAIKKYLQINAIVISSKTNNGIVLDVENPKEVGCDRIANAAAAYNIYKTSAVVVDFGTATNFDVITSDGRFIGGIIAPGIKMSSESFSKFTNLLPKLKVEDIDSVIGKNTIQNMLSGIIIGHAAMIDGLIDRIEKDLGEPVVTIATGGFANTVAKHLKRPFNYINPDLTLNGLKIIYNLNKDLVML